MIVCDRVAIAQIMTVPPGPGLCSKVPESGCVELYDGSQAYQDIVYGSP